MSARRRRAAGTLLITILLAAAIAVTGSGTSPLAGANANPGCGPTDPIGARWPLLFVHGYTSSPSTWATAVRRFCSSSVFATTFDYANVNTNWVTDPRIGPALARKILSIANASHASGGPGKVLLVGHSLGGLAIRCAADGRCNGGIGAPAGQPSPVAKAIAGITTFGTPNLGTVLKSGGKSLVSDVLGPLLSALCYGTQAANFGANDLLNGMCALERAYGTSAAASAFTPGSDELRNLPSQPAGVPVRAVAGKGLLGVRMFWNTIEVYDKGTFDSGDFIVSRASAEAQNRVVNGFGGITEVNCGSATISVTGGNTKRMNCWHGSETSTAAFLDQVQAMVEHFTTAPVTEADLLSAPVPALRGNPAGRLVNGNLSGPTGGGISLIRTGGASPTYGDITGDGIPDAAAVVASTSGVGGGDEYVELYTNGGSLLGGFDPARVDPNGYHAYVMAMIIRDGSVLIDWSTDHGGGSTGRSFWSARLRWDGHQIVISDLKPHTGITASGLWSDAILTISTQGLGAVRIGMTRQEAQDAAGFYFDGSGDGFSYPTALPDGYPHDYIGGATSVSCVGAQGEHSGAQDITTPEGVRLGDPATKIKDIYTDAAVQVPAPSAGFQSRAGYIVSRGARRLAFVVDSSTNTISGIAAGGADLTPSSCYG